MLPRNSEWVAIAYFSYAAVLSHLLPVGASIAAVTTALNLAVIASLFLAAYADSLRRRPLLGITRDWYIPLLVLLAYREMGWFAPPHHTFELERAWVRWDKLFLNEWGARGIIESLGPVLPSVLEISYSLVYVIPYFCLAMIYAYGRRGESESFLFPFVLSVMLCYSLFPYFPSEPPRTVFPGEDFPVWNTVFRRFNWWLLGGYGIHTSVFPSAHVTAAFAAAFAVRKVLRDNRWAGRTVMAMAVLIATATVYGRYHYLVDALAGFGIAAGVHAIRRLPGLRPRASCSG